MGDYEKTKSKVYVERDGISSTRSLSLSLSPIHTILLYIRYIGGNHFLFLSQPPFPSQAVALHRLPTPGQIRSYSPPRKISPFSVDLLPVSPTTEQTKLEDRLISQSSTFVFFAPSNSRRGWSQSYVDHNCSSFTCVR